MHSIAHMSAAQAEVTLTAISARAKALLVSALGYLDNTTSDGERSLRYVNRLIENTNRFDRDDLANLAATVGSTLVVAPAEAVDELENIVMNVVDQDTHEVLLTAKRAIAGNSGPVGRLTEQRSGCCCDCIIGYIDERGVKFDTDRISAISEFNSSCRGRDCRG